MLKTAICDDIALHLKEAESLIRSFFEKKGISTAITVFSSGTQLLLSIREDDYQPDIAVLDIEMDGVDGITLAKEINALLPGCRIIFLTAYPNYAPDAYLADHVWFVPKDRAENYMEAALERALEAIRRQEAASPGILIRENGVKIFIPVGDVLYISKIGRKSVVFCRDGSERHDTRRPALLIPESLSDRFLQCHQGYWVNIEMIRELDHESFILTNGARIPISRSFRDTARSRFFEAFRL